MLKILIKAAILVFIILSVYFIVNPSACSNLMLGRVVNSADKEPVVEDRNNTHREVLIPSGDYAEPHLPGSSEESKQAQGDPSVTHDENATPAIIDTNTLTEQEKTQSTNYSQEDIDYAIASRYVELENEYAKKNKLTKDSAKEISYQVMDDFELTPQEWESFLQRATQTNLFNQIRTEMAAGQ